MICSSLTTHIVDFGTKNSNQRTQKITKLTPHHMAGVTKNAVGVANWHRNAGVSANYYIAEDQIVAGVSEDRRTWASSSPSNDQQAITFEVANSGDGTKGWPVSDASYRSLVRLCAEICTRYGIVPHYDGTKNGTITMHKQFAQTACPGPYLTNLIVSHQFENDILAAMDAAKKETAQEQAAAPSIPPVPFMVRVKAQDAVYRVPSMGVACGMVKKGIYTIVDVSGNFGKLKSGAGWIFLADPTKTEQFRKGAQV